MAQYALQASNVFSYTFGGLGTSNNYIFAGNNNPILNIFGDSWTVEFWIKPTGNYTNNNFLFTKRPTSALPTAYTAYISTTGALAWFTNTGSDIVSTGVRVMPNTWNHVAYVNNGANLRIFLNGSNVASNVAGQYTQTSNGNVDAIFAIGTHPAVPATSQFFGDISNFRMVKGQALYSGNFSISNFPFQLSNSSIGPHAGSTNVAASLTGNVILLTCNDQRLVSNGNTTINLLTTVGDVYPHLVDSKEMQNFSYFFPGNTSARGQNGTVLVTSTTNSLNLNTADFTIETWFYPTSNTGIILERGYGGERNNLASYILIFDTPNSSINFAVANANNAAGYAVGGLTGPSGNVGRPTINAWNHIAVTRTGTTYRGFLNGTLNLTITPNANNPYDAVGRGLTVGGMWNNGQTYATGIPANTISGYISNLRMIRGNSIYNASFTVSNTQLINVTNTILLTGQTPVFEDLSGTHTLAVNGQNQIFFSTLSPVISNTANVFAQTNVNSSIFRADGQRQSRIYDRFNLKLTYGRSPLIAQTIGIRMARIYDRFNLKLTYGRSEFMNKAMGARQPRIYDRFNPGEMIQGMDRIYNRGNYTIGSRQSKINSKFITDRLGYVQFPTSVVNAANVRYQFWS